LPETGASIYLSVAGGMWWCSFSALAKDSKGSAL